MICTVEVEVDPPSVAQVDVAWIQEVGREVFVQESHPACPPRPGREVEKPVELTVVITDDARMRELNRRYRGVDSPTDVLAFGGEAEEFVEAPGSVSYLGDVVVSYPRAQAQADERGHSQAKELALLIIHGMLHLLGYDHATPQEEAIMWARQDAILRRLGYS